MSVRLCATIAGLTLLVASIMAPAQSDKRRSEDLLARVSYQSTYTPSRSDWKSSRVCFALYRNGRYQLVKVATEKTEVLQGTLSRDELRSISRMLRNLDPEKSSKGVIIENHSESFVALLVRGDGTASYIWTDPDRRRPFPTATLRIVNWLQNFRAQGASPLLSNEMAEFSICPPASVTPVPAVASLMGMYAGSTCGRNGR